MKIRCLLILIIGILPVGILAQGDYYKTDKDSIVNIKLADQGIQNYLYCHILEGKLLQTYSPNNILEYGFKDGRKYISKEILLDNKRERVFLEQLADGKIDLYYFENASTATFFYEDSAGSLVQLPKKDIDNGRLRRYRSDLFDLTSDCLNTEYSTERLRYSKNTLSKFISAYNNCEAIPRLPVRYGIKTGFGLTRLFYNTVDEESFRDELKYSYKAGWLIGVFIEKPFQYTDFSIYSEINYSYQRYLYTGQFGTTEVKFKAEVSKLELPLLIKYSNPNIQSRPFFGLGPVLGLNFRSIDYYAEGVDINGQFTPIFVSNNPQISSFSAGYSIIGGVEIKILKGLAIPLEIRYTWLYPASGSRYIKQSGFYLLTGFRF